MIEETDSIEKINKWIDWLIFDGTGEPLMSYLGYDGTVWIKTVQDINSNQEDDDFI